MEIWVCPHRLRQHLGSQSSTSNMGSANSSNSRPVSSPDPDAHLQLFNPDFTAPASGDNPVFHCFPLLPTELRRKVWRHALERRRLIKIFIHNYRFHPSAKSADSTDDSIHHYPVVVGYQSLSKLLRVNRESRQAALEFFRVAIPCRFSSSSDESESRNADVTHPGTFYFNPEYDFLHLVPEPEAQETLLEFIHHLKTVHDPRRVGLRNVAFDGNSLADVLTKEPDEVDPDVRQSFRETLEQLLNVYLLNYTATGRQCEGWRSGYCGEVFFNRSLPVLGQAPSFELLPRDPRPIDQDLRRVYTGLDHATRAAQMGGLFHTWRARPRDAQYKYLLSFQPQEPDTVYDRESARRLLKKQEDHWRWCAVGGSAPGDQSRPFGNIKWPAITIPDEDLQSVPRPAVGFWLFPVDILSDEDLRSSPLNDLSKYWPELGLLSFS